MERDEIKDGLYNVGSGLEKSIKELVTIVAETAGFKGSVVLDWGKPEGMSRKLLDVTRLGQLGLSHKVKLKTGVKLAYES